MFDLITGTLDRPLRDRRAGPAVVSILTHAIVLTAIVVPFLYATGQMPRVQHGPEMMAFIATEIPPVPPPQAPRPAPDVPPREQAAPPKATPASAPQVRFEPAGELAPIETPRELLPEPEGVLPYTSGSGGFYGESGGTGAGMLGGVIEGVPLAPPAPPPPAPQKPIRVGGLIAPPTLLVRVEPIYPAFAANAQIGGVVILEATVGSDGFVQTVRVLTGHPLLNQTAVDAVKQWRYKPILLDDVPIPFILTVTVNFRTVRRQG